ncbi:M20 family metallopeptidase [Halodesulfovibrio marinisediminis]|uniref:Glutamate carboxypeptidase n=1 Tax=Halodesulfovibrio marinisediminis DSM 17456 TaxID=1121457 RepID=A0A1N6GRF9_9BACT|nr:M20 family metallopeptidase [Halodesulfovibrio marinisediminis]SIO10114.1 glutamate carboxypeptidase [Halodesulfovibrio marinisediminis DSM 17456]
MIKKVQEFIAAREQDMVSLLKKLVEINSYTGNKAGVDAVASVIQGECESMGLHVRREPRENVGDNLVIETQLHKEGRKGILMCGHMDTVFPSELGFNTFTQDETTYYGPGVADMKCGLVLGIYVLKALDSLGLLQDMSIAMICNSDEETGSSDSSELILKETENSFVGFVLESTKEGGEFVIGRKGRMTFELEVTGKAAHAGNVGADKASAILELAKQVQAYEELNNPEEGTSVNVGKIEGGVGANTVAEKARAIVEFRYTQKNSGDRVWETIQNLAANPFNNATTCTVSTITARPSMVTNDAILGLYDMIKEIGVEHGFEIQCAQCGGGSDANFMSQLGIPVIDGLGPRGGNLHSVDEYLVASTVPERTVLATLVVAEAWKRYCCK